MPFEPEHDPLGRPRDTSPRDRNGHTRLEIHPDDDVRRVIVEHHVHTQVQEPRSSLPLFVAGFSSAATVAAIAAILILTTTDRDDGNINVEAPVVDVDVDPDPGD